MYIYLHIDQIFIFTGHQCDPEKYNMCCKLFIVLQGHFWENQRKNFKKELENKSLFYLALFTFKNRTLIHSCYLRVVHPNLFGLTFLFVSWESELQASEVSSDGYLQFLFVVAFEVKSITAYVQTDFAHLTPLGFQ